VNTDAATWRLTCLICGRQDDDLVALQEHGMARHDITRDDLRRAARRNRDTDTQETYTWTLPDGRDWLHAVRTPKREGRL